jgi:hypothetical protein
MGDVAALLVMGVIIPGVAYFGVRWLCFDLGRRPTKP